MQAETPRKGGRGRVAGIRATANSPYGAGGSWAPASPHARPSNDQLTTRWPAYFPSHRTAPTKTISRDSKQVVDCRGAEGRGDCSGPQRVLLGATMFCTRWR